MGWGLDDKAPSPVLYIKGGLSILRNLDIILSIGKFLSRS